MDEAPPAYSEKAQVQVIPNSSSIATSIVTAPLTTHLTTLPHRIAASQASHQTAQQAADLGLLTLLLPHIEDFLAYISELPKSPAAAELVLVPDAAVPAGWLLTGMDERVREGEVVCLARVSAIDDAKGDKMDNRAPTKNEKKSDTTAETYHRNNLLGDFPVTTVNGIRTSWWWRDELMARRLANYLQPKTAIKTERHQIQAAVEQKRGGGGGWLKRMTSGSPATKPAAPRRTPVELGAPIVERGDDDRVSMRVRCQEVTFRKDNSFGVWESMRGFGLVVVVQIKGI